MEPFLLIESAIHLIDVARFLEIEIDEVYCDMRRVSGVTRGEDNVHLHLRLGDGVWGIMYSTRGSEPDFADPVCDYARIEGIDGFIRLERDGTITVKPFGRCAFEHGHTLSRDGYRGDSVRQALEHFSDCLIANEPFETEGDDYLRQVMVTVFAGYQSAETRKAVKLSHSSNADNADERTEVIPMPKRQL
jgi:predicted dehydrogenase